MSLPGAMLAVTVAGGPRAVRTAPPDRRPGEVLIKVRRVGICGTDFKLFDGYTDFQGVIGHEFVGTVIEADDPDLIGRRVTSSINLPPLDADPTFDWTTVKHHPRRTAPGIRHRDGVMAEYASLPPQVLVPLPDEVSDTAAAMAEPLAAALQTLEALPDKLNPVLVVGDGRVGQLVVRVLRAAGREVHLLGKHAGKKELAVKAGAYLADKQRIGPETRYAAVIEATGSAEGVRDALAATAPEGTLVLNTTLPEPVGLDLSRIVVDEITLVGSRCGDIARAVALLAEHAVEVEDLVTATYPLAQAEQAFEHARRKDALKIQLTV